MEQECVAGFVPQADDGKDKDFGVFYGMRTVVGFYLVGIVLAVGAYVAFIR